MTNTEAIQILAKERICVNRDCDTSRCNGCDLVMPSKEPIDEALKMAIEALDTNESLRSTLRHQYEVLIGEVKRQAQVVENIRTYVKQKYDLYSNGENGIHCVTSYLQESTKNILEFIDGEMNTVVKDTKISCENVENTYLG